jgi:hypothetical protein
MNNTHDQATLLTKLSKLYVFGELGLDPKTFAATPDTAWIGFADRLLRHQPQQRPHSPRRAVPLGRSR